MSIWTFLVWSTSTQHFNPHMFFRQCFGRSSHLTPALFSKKHLNYWIPTAPGTHVFPQGIALSQPTLPSQQICFSFFSVFPVFFLWILEIACIPWESAKCPDPVKTMKLFSRAESYCQVVRIGLPLVVVHPQQSTWLEDSPWFEQNDLS